MYRWAAEANHGVVESSENDQGPATVFPQVINLAATFNEHLWEEVGRAVGLEARALYTNASRTGTHARHGWGLSFHAPTANVYRDARWGRGQETAGEDPEMVAQYVHRFVRGLQGGGLEDSVHSQPALLAAGTCKDWAAYSLEHVPGTTTTRHNFNTKLGERDVIETYSAPFASCTAAGAAMVMCSYSSVDGVPLCASSRFLDHYLRREFKFSGR